MSEIKVNKISPATGTETTLGDASDDFLLPSGAEIIAQSGSTITVASGATLANAGTATGFGGGKTVKRAYYTYATRTAGSGSTGVQFNFTTSYIPVDPTVNDIQVQMVCRIRATASDWSYYGVRFAKSGGSNYDYLGIGHTYCDPNSYQSDYSSFFNIPANDLPAGTYTVSLYAGNSNAALSSNYFCLNTTDHSTVGVQTKATLMLTEWKN